MDTPSEAIEELMSESRELRRMGRHPDAERVLREALPLAERAHDELVLATTEHELGVVRRCRGGFAESARLLAHALAVTEEELGPRHPYVATILHNVAQLELARGRPSAAEPLARRAFGIRELALGPEHVATAATAATLATALAERQRLNEAEQLLHDAGRRLDGGVAASDHPEVADVLEARSTLELARGRSEPAVQLARNALEIKERTLTPAHLDLVPALTRLGEALVATGQPDAAGEHFTRAISILEQNVEPQHPGLAECRAARAALRPVSHA